MSRSVYIHTRFYGILGAITLLFVLGVFAQIFFVAGIVTLGLFVLATVYDFTLLFRTRSGTVEAHRTVAGHLSNGDQNRIVIDVHSKLTFRANITVIDELPVQFQARDMHWTATLQPGSEHIFEYQIRPVERGEYSFGAVHVFVRTPLGFGVRRFSVAADTHVKVYPSYLQLRKYAFLAFDQRLRMPGLKRMRRLGHTSEFEHIKEYVPGDDTRTLNWKATARTGRAMVNQYRDERAQPVYCLIDKGRLMQMPFRGMSLLDYAINTALVMSYIAIKKEDHAGLLTYAERPYDFVYAGRRNNQLYRISEALYKQETAFLEADFERLYITVSRNLPHRSLLLLFTNFTTLSGLRRQLPYLKKIAEKHILVVIFFQNTELRRLIETKAHSLRALYHQTIAEKMQDEKEGMLLLLRQHGLYGVLSAPEELTVDTINQYLEMKARGVA